MPKVKVRFFLLYSDGKRVRELASHEYYDLYTRNSRVCAFTKNGISFAKSKNYVWIPREQFLQVAREALKFWGRN